MKKVYEVKTLDEAKKQAAIDFAVELESIEFKVIKESKGFFGIGSKIEVEASLKVSGIDKGKEYIQMILDHNEVKGEIEVTENEKEIHYNIEAGDYNGYLIGKTSRNLIALQTLVSNVVNKYYGEDEYRIVIIDVGGYRRRREKNIENMAVEWGKEVARTRVAIRVTDLNAYERKVIHNKLSTWRDVQTHSEGEGENRVLIIEPKDMRGDK